MNKQTKTGQNIQNNFEGIGHEAWGTVMTERLKANYVSSMIILYTWEKFQGVV